MTTASRSGTSGTGTGQKGTGNRAACAAETIARLAARAGVGLPVRLRAWDGAQRTPLAGPVSLVGAASAAAVAGIRLGIFGPPPAPPSCELRHSGRPHSRVRDLPQAVILWVACLPVQAGMVQQAPLSAITVAGCAVWLIGFFFEAVGDWQLTRFRADPVNRGRIMDRGLWRYTRHPNYFGDTCMWWGIFGISYGSAVQLVTIVSPLLMTVILTRGTGQRLTDRRMAQTRPDYAEYAARTSGFIPLPPRPPRRVLPDGYRDRGLHPRPARAR